MRYVDIPTAADLRDIATQRHDVCVSIYLRTTPITQNTVGDRIALKNFAKEAVDQLAAAGADKRRTVALAEHLDDLIDDDEFWRFQAHSLAIFATPDNVRTFRVPSALQPVVEVADRFFLKPLLRATTFPHAAYVLALAEGGVRVIEASADLPATEIRIDGMPKDAASAVGRASVNDRSPSGRLQGSEGEKVLLAQFARKVDNALRPLLAGGQTPLILAAAQPLAAIYRAVNSYAHLSTMTIDGSPANVSDAKLVDRAREALDQLYSGEIERWGALFATREKQGRATTDIAQAARAATRGAIESLAVDIDQIIHGVVDEDGAVVFADRPSANSYGVVDEIAARTLQAGGQVLGVRAKDVPNGGALAAILRYPA